MNKKQNIDSGLLSKLKSSVAPVDAPQSPVQKIVPVSDSQRNGETQCNFWMNKSLKKAMQAQAIKEDTDLKSIFVTMGIRWCEERGIDWEKY